MPNETSIKRESETFSSIEITGRTPKKTTLPRLLAVMMTTPNLLRYFLSASRKSAVRLFCPELQGESIYRDIIFLGKAVLLKKWDKYSIGAGAF